MDDRQTVSSLPSISAVLPAHDETAVIEDVVRRTHQALTENRVPAFEVIVVDDGSRDGTGDVVRSLAASLPEVRVVSHAENLGYGAALRSGFEAASHEATWLMDSDGQFDPADLQRLLPHYRPDTMVAGYRVRRSDAFVRRLNHRAFFMLVRARWGRIARDVNCGFKLFPSAAGRGLRAHGAMISTELLLRAQRSGYRLSEVAVPHYPRLHGMPSGARPAVVVRAFREFWEMATDEEVLQGLAPPAEGVNT